MTINIRFTDIWNNVGGEIFFVRFYLKGLGSLDFFFIFLLNCKIKENCKMLKQMFVSVVVQQQNYL